MRNNSTHAMFPGATHDEQALQNFIKSMRVHATKTFIGGNKDLVREMRKDTPIPTRHAMRDALARHPDGRWWSAMMRTTQEMLYDSVGPSIERQLPELVDKARALKGKRGSLTLDENVTIPPYLAAVDMHCKPGSYQQEIVADDVFAGAEFDRTYRLYSMGGFGPNLDGAGRILINWLKETYPDFQPKRILDIGCTVGHSTLPYCDAWPDTEVHAIDVAATCLRYGHARAVAMEKEVHFAQKNAEATDYPDGYFDLVVSHAVMHETSAKALPAIFKECRRLLSPGGIMAHMDGIYPETDDLDFMTERYYTEWMAHFNNEPFLGTVQDQDFVGLCKAAGFAEDKVIRDRAKHVDTVHAGDLEPVKMFFVVSAQA